MKFADLCYSSTARCRHWLVSNWRTRRHGYVMTLDVRRHCPQPQTAAAAAAAAVASSSFSVAAETAAVAVLPAAVMTQLRTHISQ